MLTTTLRRRSLSLSQLHLSGSLFKVFRLLQVLHCRGDMLTWSPVSHDVTCSVSQPFWLKWLGDAQAASDLALTSTFFGHTLVFSLIAPRLLPWILCAFRNEPLSRRLFFSMSHSAHQQMSRFLIPRSTHSRRLSQTHFLFALAVPIYTCVLLSVMTQAMVSPARACLPAPTHLSRLSSVTCPSARPSSSQFSPKARKHCRHLETTQQSQRHHKSNAGMDAHSTSATPCIQPRSLLLKRRASFLTGLCHRLQDLRAQSQKDGHLIVSLRWEYRHIPAS